MISVRPADASFSECWLRLRKALWPNASPKDLRHDVEQFFAGRAKHLKAVFFAHNAADALIGFAELNIRPYAEGCLTDRVAFLEGWYVEPEYRVQGVGVALIKASETWALANGCVEFASDALSENHTGRAAHLAVGFEEVETIRCFRKPLASAVAQPAVPADVAASRRPTEPRR
jgi:aminoglycoside 6'-N-acetyltransferase I